MQDAAPAQKLQTFKTWIGGNWVDAASGKRFPTYNPYTAEAWGEIPECDATDVERAVSAAHAAFESKAWSGMTQSARGKLLRRIGDLAMQHAEYFGQLETRDNGKLISEMSIQTKFLTEWYYFYAGLADKITGAVVPSDKPDHFCYTLREPLGVCAFILPWNSPLLLLAYKLAPALATGNTVVVKPSEFTSASTLEFCRLVLEPAGVPKGVVNVITGYGAVVGEPMVTHPRVAKVAFTGGNMTGARINELAAKTFKKVSLELGGKSPNIVFEDAVLDDAVNGAVSGIFAASGQTCIAGSRLLLQESIHDKFVEKLLALAKTAKLGDPSKFETQVGPVTTPPQYQKILGYIDIAKGEGAQCVLGGGAVTKAEGGGTYFVKPTIFTGVSNKMRIAQEEVFGPVLSIIPFKDEAHAVEIANDVIYGLGSGVWTRDVSRALTMASKIKAGTVWVNTYRAVSPLMPFGGFKASGLGRENGATAIDEYLQHKAVWINLGGNSGNPFVMKTAAPT